jgi:hypothetical protein
MGLAIELNRLKNQSKGKDLIIAELEATVIEQAKKIQALETQVSILPTAEAPK